MTHKECKEKFHGDYFIYGDFSHLGDVFLMEDATLNICAGLPLNGLFRQSASVINSRLPDEPLSGIDPF